MKHDHVALCVSLACAALLAACRSDPERGADAYDGGEAHDAAFEGVDADVRAAPASSPRPAATMARPNEEMQAVLDALAELGGKPLVELEAAEARRQPTPTDAVAALLAERGEEPPASPCTEMQREIQGAAGGLPARVFVPQGSGPFPVILYFHGGGWVLADAATYAASARALCEGARAVVVSPDYRRAPEHDFPAAHEDALAAYRWTRDNAATLGGDPRHVAVAGESAGGNLAAAVSLMARAEGLAVPAHQLLVYPVASTSLEWPSVAANAGAQPLDEPMLVWFLDQYAPDDEDRRDPRIDLLSADLAGMPPTTVITAEIDPLRSEGIALVRALENAGVPVVHRDYRGVAHEFFGMAPVLAEARDAQQFAAQRLQDAFARRSEPAAAGQGR